MLLEQVLLDLIAVKRDVDWDPPARRRDLQRRRRGRPATSCFRGISILRRTMRTSTLLRSIPPQLPSQRREGIPVKRYERRALPKPRMQAHRHRQPVPLVQEGDVRLHLPPPPPPLSVNNQEYDSFIFYCFYFTIDRQ
jgi:hypothetical protein